ncbi:MAG: glycosyltransferase family 4 protein [Armatimonadetes bacterium]|nr:glycosyltransferase family 4 protein [Armatimonadota bacterium]
MHVLLDARVILAAKTGDRTYWLGLLEALPRVAPEHRFTVALDGEPPHGLLHAADNLAIEVVERPRGRLWTLFALPRLARRLGCDLIHLQYTAPPKLPCPFVSTVHDCSFVRYPHTFRRFDRWWLSTLVPWTARRAGAVVGVSETTRNDLLELYRLPPDRVFAAPNGIGPEYQPAAEHLVEAVRALYELPAEYLLSVGVLQPRKNLPGLFAAYAEARTRYGVQIPLVVVGKRGWLLDEIDRAVEDLQLQKFVRFTGYVPDDEVPALYTGATLSLYPSFYEGFGLPPLESMACGTPAVVSTTPALVEVTGDAAPHLPPTDTAAWAEAIARLLGDPAERARLAEHGRLRAAEFTWERSARVHLEAYQRALDTAP